MVNDGPSTEHRTESNTRKESANIEDFLKTRDTANITEILIDNEKFQAHIKEIDMALNNGPNISKLTNISNDDIDCRTDEAADKALTDMNISGPVVEELLDQGPNTKAPLDSGPIINNPMSRTWKRITTGPRIANPNSEENHVGSKRGVQDHAKDELNTTLKRKKTEAEVANLHHLSTTASDHCIFALRWNQGKKQRPKGAKPFRVVTPCPVAGADSLVATLIDYQRGEWDLEAFQSTLMPKDVESALSIALSPTLPEDCLIWALTPSRKFTVKSTYRIALAERPRHRAEESSNATCMKEFWRGGYWVNGDDSVGYLDKPEWGAPWKE
nr:hypothetical protein CFP56_75757 [Quercus suber]